MKGNLIIVALLAAPFMYLGKIWGFIRCSFQAGDHDMEQWLREKTKDYK
jgi:hypothetical protein